jgi:K+-transporting ATPase ATPase C chain
MRELRAAAIAIAVLSLILGLAYPLAMTAASQVAFPHRADGSARLLGHAYPKDLFQPRPSATGYSTDPTAFNNQGPNQQDLAGQLKGFVAAYLKRERPYTPDLTPARIPADAVTTSASGIDPDISEANARIQANRVAKERRLPLARVLALVDGASHRPLLGLAGERSINLFGLNTAVEATR